MKNVANKRRRERVPPGGKGKMLSHSWPMGIEATEKPSARTPALPFLPFPCNFLLSFYFYFCPSRASGPSSVGKVIGSRKADRVATPWLTILFLLPRDTFLSIVLMRSSTGSPRASPNPFSVIDSSALVVVIGKFKGMLHS